MPAHPRKRSRCGASEASSVPASPIAIIASYRQKWKNTSSNLSAACAGVGMGGVGMVELCMGWDG